MYHRGLKEEEKMLKIMFLKITASVIWSQKSVFDCWKEDEIMSGNG